MTHTILNKIISYTLQATTGYRQQYHTVIAILTFLLCLSTAWIHANRVAAQSVGPDIGPKAKFTVKPAPPGSIQAQVAEQQDPIVQLNIDRNPVQVGEEVKFTLTPPDLVANSHFIFTFDFGDGTPEKVKEANQAEITHEYRASGSYTVSVSVQIRPGIEIFEEIPKVGNTLKVQVNNWSLAVNPTTVKVGQPVSFEARPSSKDPNIRYRFAFGESSQPGNWGDRPEATYAYSSARTYSAYAEIGRINGLINGDSINSIIRIPTRISVIPLPRPTPINQDGRFDDVENWWMYLIIGLSVLLVGYWVWKLQFPRLTFHPHPDPGVTHLKNRTELAIDFQIRLNPDVAGGHYRLSNHETSLIRSERRMNA